MTLIGEGGNDVIQGGSGNDIFSCGLGQDAIGDFNQQEGDIKSRNCENF
jgi:Ca2+-binding RTX toxin-like protein